MLEVVYVVAPSVMNAGMQNPEETDETIEWLVDRYNEAIRFIA